MMRGMLVAAGTGAALMYLFDPQRGRCRRAERGPSTITPEWR